MYQQPTLISQDEEEVMKQFERLLNKGDQWTGESCEYRSSFCKRNKRKIGHPCQRHLRWGEQKRYWGPDSKVRIVCRQDLRKIESSKRTDLL